MHESSHFDGGNLSKEKGKKKPKLDETQTKFHPLSNSIRLQTKGGY